MKRIFAFLMILSLFVGVMAFTASAEETLPRDITDDIKWITAYDMYMQRLPVVRDDAVFIHPMDYEASTAPGSGVRDIVFTDWEEVGMEDYFDDYFSFGDGFFSYDAVWAKSVDVPYDHGLMTYTFEVEEAGTYELVFVGAAQRTQQHRRLSVVEGTFITVQHSRYNRFRPITAYTLFGYACIPIIWFFTDLSSPKSADLVDLAYLFSSFPQKNCKKQKK